MSHFNGFLILTLCYASSSSYAATEAGPYLKTIRADGNYKSKSNNFNDNDAGMNALIDELKMLRNQADDESTRVEKNLQSYKKETSPNKLSLDGKQHRYDDKIMPHLDYLMMRLESEAPQKLANLDRRYQNDVDRYDKRNFDPIDRSGFSTFVKKSYLDPIDRSGFATYVKKNIDPIDRSGFGSFVKKNLDPFDISGFGTYIKRNFDTFDRSGFSTFNKKAFDPIDASGFRGYVKKSPFDTIDRSGFSDFVKKNIDPIDRSGFSTFTKKNIDPIDRSGFSSFTKKNIDPIDRSGFGNFVKRNNRNYDTIDAASFAKQAAPSSTKQMSEIIYK